MTGYRLIGKLLRSLPPETAHRVTLRALRAGVVRKRTRTDSSSNKLKTNIFGLDLANPIGLAAGFDKNAEAIAALLGLGFGHVEVGTITPLPQPGNPKPRVFRLNTDRAVINRLGFNSAGMEIAARRCAAFRDRYGEAPVVGVNLGKNRDSTDATADYAAVAGRLAPFASYLAVNVSSPNTPGLRALQDSAELVRIVDSVREAANRHPRPVIVKVAPDLTERDIDDIAVVALDEAFDGLIVGNTTISRPESLRAPERMEAGGLSGRPLYGLSTRVLAEFGKRVGGRVALIGVGGIETAGQIQEKFRAGASAVQLYTGLIFHGPRLVERLLEELATTGKQ